MPVKYTQYKQTCQTLQQNVVQLNERVTTIWGKRIGIASISLLVVVLLLYRALPQRNVARSYSSPQLNHHKITSLPSLSFALAATKDATPTPSSPTITVQPTNAELAERILLATPTPLLTVTSVQALSINELTTLTTTLDMQNRIAISVATVAQALWATLQQPIVFQPIPISVSAAPDPMTTTSGTLPPLTVPTVGLLPSTNGATPTPDRFVITPPELQGDSLVRTAHVPVLMYHYLSEPPADADIYRRDLSVSPALFAAHLDRIAAEGYTVITLYDLMAYLLQGTAIPEKAVVITFDDGYRDNYENAFPLLRERGMSATFFIVMEFINLERPEYLTWPMVQEMAAAGMSIEAHGVDHTTLRGRNDADLAFQALRSYETIQNAVGRRARFISYPAGEFDETTIDTFREAGYWAGFTTVQGATLRSDDLFRLPRVRIRGTTTPDELARLLALDW